MTKKVLLVYPEIPLTHWSFRYALPFAGKKAMMAPLGLITVAAMLPADYECRLVDINVRPLTDGDLEWTDMVFVSAMLVQKEAFEQIVARSNAAGKTVVAGGPYPTSSFEDIRGVDHFILGEAENVFPRFLEDYAADAAERVYRGEGRPDITMTPVPRFDLLDVNSYYLMALQYSRGCPFSCEFCDIVELFGHKPRTKSPEQFIAEMEAVYATGFRGPLFVVDDNFIGNKHNVKELLRSMIPWQEERGYPYRVLTEASINLAADEELMDLMQAANFHMVFIGIETPVKESLAETGKAQNLKGDLLEGVRRIQSRGIEVTAGFIVGFDSDPETVFEQQLAFIAESGIPNAMAGLLMALPGTKLSRRLKAENRLLSASEGNNTHSFELNYIPVMPREKLIDGYRDMLAEIYDPRNYFDRCLDLLRRMPVRKSTDRAIHLGELRSLALSFFKQGFSDYGAEYFRFFMKTFFIKPGHLARAVSMAIEGYHFIRITREMLAADDFREYVQGSLEELQTRVASVDPAREAGVLDGIAEYGRSLSEKIRKRYCKLDKGARHHVRRLREVFEVRLADELERLERLTGGQAPE